MKYFLITFFGLFLASVGTAQPIKISFSAGANLPFINNINQQRVRPFVDASTGFVSTSTQIYIDQKYTTYPGLQVGVNGAYPINKKFSITSGLWATHYRYQQTLEVNSNGGVILDGIDFSAIYNNVAILTGSPMLNQPNGRFNNLNLLPATPSDKGETRALYLTIPAMADYHFAKRWSVSAGFNAHIIMAAQVMRYNYSYSINNGTYTVQAEDRSADGFTNVLVSAATQVRFQLVKQVSLDLGYSYTLTPIYDRQVANTAEQAKYKVLSLSARYWLTL